MKLFFAIALLMMTSAAGNAALVYSFAGGGSLGDTHSYGAPPIIVTGYSADGTTTDLFGKGTAGVVGGENGVGLTRYLDHEIPVGAEFIQLDVMNLSSLILQVSMGSVTNGETFRVTGSNTAGVRGATVLTVGNTEGYYAIANTFRYLDVAATGAKNDNVLVSSLTAATGVPEPSAGALIALGAACLVAGKVRRKAIVQA